MKTRKTYIYKSPLATVSELECESTLLANSLRLVPEVDELENVNTEADASYFEYEF